MATYTSSFTGSQIDAGVNNSLVYTAYDTLLTGFYGTITNTALATAISHFQPVQLNFAEWIGEGGAICRFLNDTMGGIVYGCIDTDGTVGIVTFSVTGTSTVGWSLSKPGLPYETSAPLSDNFDGLKLVVTSTDPVNKQDGYIYFITSSS